MKNNGSSNNLPCYPPDSHQCQNAVYWKLGGKKKKNRKKPGKKKERRGAKERKKWKKNGKEKIKRKVKKNTLWICSLKKNFLVIMLQKNPDFIH